ncbi:MAG: hypothetical protein ACI9WU_003604 [Myxococcota bacterium]
MEDSLIYPIMSALQPVLFVVPDVPGALLPSANNWDEESWWLQKALPVTP